MPTWSEYGVWLRSEKQQRATIRAHELLIAHPNATDDEKDAARRVIARIEERMARRQKKRGTAA